MKTRDIAEARVAQLERELAAERKQTELFRELRCEKCGHHAHPDEVCAFCELAAAKHEIAECRNSLRDNGYHTAGWDYPGDELSIKDLTEHWHGRCAEYWSGKLAAVTKDRDDLQRSIQDLSHPNCRMILKERDAALAALKT